jgi:hypothetical protein
VELEVLTLVIQHKQVALVVDKDLLRQVLVLLVQVDKEVLVVVVVVPVAVVAEEKVP